MFSPFKNNEQMINKVKNYIHRGSVFDILLVNF